MLSDLQNNKMTRAFRLFDADHDGFVERRDIDIIVDNIAKARGASADSDEYAGVKATYADFWSVLATLDADGDGRVTSDEWLLAMENIIKSEGRFEEIIGQLRDLLFALFDTDNDGKVSAQEYTGWLTAYHESEGSAAEAFLKLDADGDGYIRKEDMDRIVKEFFYSDAADAAGNWLLGNPN